MSRIHIMSELLSNKIAAGEVVERTASVVKELVENAIDAKATQIDISLKDGGLKEIKVKDNGIGMDKEDAHMAFLRHATSKINKEDDLFFIDTLGFRGEALASIASVSQVTLNTYNGQEATYLVIKGGKEIETKEGLPIKGSEITITDLFYNTPARLKFLKSENTELYHSTSFIEKLALSYPEIKFSLTNNDNLILKTSGSNDLKKTIHEIYGLQISSKLIEIQAFNDDYDIKGYICKPEILKSNKNYMITIVNGRVVHNYELNKAINDAYYTYKPDIKYPIVVLKIDTDPTLIDVNIHPTKQDIKMSKLQELHQLITDTINKALKDNLLIQDAALRYDKTYTPEDNTLEEIVNNFVGSNKEVVVNDTITYDKVPANQQTFDFGEVNEETVSLPNEELRSLVLYPVGQALGTYIIAENDTGLYLVDQHAAQERVNYEKFMKLLKEQVTSTIKPLIPIVIELPKSDALKLKEELPYLESLGFALEEFGINTYKIIKEPTWLTQGHEEENVRTLIDLVINKSKEIDRIKFNEHIAITLACKMSIKANMKITFEDMNEILKELVKCDNPYNCPHGRPTIIKFSIYDLERMFKRVMN